MSVSASGADLVRRRPMDGPGLRVATSSVAMASLLAASTMPVRLTSVPVLGDLSLLSAVVIALGTVLAVEAVLTGRLEAGHPRVLLTFSLPLAAALLSVIWSVDLALTVRATLVYLQTTVAYLLVIRFARGWSADRVWAWIRAFAYLLIIPAALLWVRVPGFGPHESGLVPDTTDYVGYYSRLSHPVLGRSNNLASVLAFFVVLLGARSVISRRARDVRAAAVALAAVLLTFSRGVFVSLVAAGALLAVSGALPVGRLIRRFLVVAGVAGVGFMVAFQLNPTVSEFFSGRLDPFAAAEDRRELVDQAIDVVLDRPAVGLGAGVSPLAPDGSQEEAHNAYVQQLVYFGFPLGFVVVGALFFLFAHFWAWGTATARIVACAIAGQLVIFSTESSFEGAVLRVIFGISVGLGMALVRARSPQVAEAHG